MTQAVVVGPSTTTTTEVQSSSGQLKRISRRVSSFALSMAAGDAAGESQEVAASASSSKRSSTSSSRPLNPLLTRQVSHDGLMAVADKESEYERSKHVRGSPVHCVSEFDQVTTGGGCSGVQQLLKTETSQSENVPPFPNILQHRRMLEQHAKAAQLEAELQPMRLILSRLIAHPTLNRKSIFNSPVDPVALGLPDYLDVIHKPMDLGTVKVKLHALAYQSRREAAQEIRLVFENAMKYNPPHNTVHMAARDLLAFFEDQVVAFVPDIAVCRDCAPSSSSSPTMPAPPPTKLMKTETGAVSTSAVTMEVSSDPLVEGSLPSSVPVLVPSQGTRRSISSVEMLAPVHIMVPRKRKKRGSRVNPTHACNKCEGRSCAICHQTCLALEPTLLICNGVSCAGAKIRKGAIYFIAKDGTRQFCQRCHTSLPAVLPCTGQDDAVRYKRDLLKRKNDEEIVENWLQCGECDRAVHQLCAMHNEYSQSDETYRCPFCRLADDDDTAVANNKSDDEVYTFLSGSEMPQRMADAFGPLSDWSQFSAEALPETQVSKFIQQKVRERMCSPDYPNAEKTVVVRILSDCQRFFKVPEVVRRHFRMASKVGNENTVGLPSKVNYRSKAIALFQKCDGLDMCLFIMYVQEYDADDTFDNAEDQNEAAQKKRVYIAYLDSVEHFRSRTFRTDVYHEILVAYLATARERGFETAHIWACPPSRGNSFVFWNHPASQRTPSMERLVSWYHGALSRAVDCGVVLDVQSLYESDFQGQLRDLGTGPDISLECDGQHVMCPPLLDGDFWIEEAVRIHGVAVNRYLKAKTFDSCEGGLGDRTSDDCPAIKLASMLRDKVIAHPASLPFRRPVNAAAMNLKDYHQVIEKPMDLGTVFSRCMLGEYHTVRDLVSDVELIVSNAKRYNPNGHVVHQKADELRDLFFTELSDMTRGWRGSENFDESWVDFAGLSLSLDATVDNDAAAEGGKVSELQQQHAMPSVDLPLVGGGPEAVQLRMVGSDRWLLDKQVPAAKGTGSVKRPGAKRRRGQTDSEDDAGLHRRRQSWLGTEVGVSVRRMRTSFFTCSLTGGPFESTEQANKEAAYERYVEDFDSRLCPAGRTSNIADARHALLEFWQFRNLEFDTIRRAKYSTAILLYHLRFDCAPGTVPHCTSCRHEIRDFRWHKVSKIVERRKSGRLAPHKCVEPEELCSSCYGHRNNDHFIPLPVSIWSG